MRWYPPRITRDITVVSPDSPLYRGGGFGATPWGEGKGKGRGKGRHRETSGLRPNKRLYYRIVRLLYEREREKWVRQSRVGGPSSPFSDGSREGGPQSLPRGVLSSDGEQCAQT